MLLSTNAVNHSDAIALCLPTYSYQRHTLGARLEDNDNPVSERLSPTFEFVSGPCVTVPSWSHPDYAKRNYSQNNAQPARSPPQPSPLPSGIWHAILVLDVILPLSRVKTAGLCTADMPRQPAPGDAHPDGGGTLAGQVEYTVGENPGDHFRTTSILGAGQPTPPLRCLSAFRYARLLRSRRRHDRVFSRALPFPRVSSRFHLKRLILTTQLPITQQHTLLLTPTTASAPCLGARTSPTIPLSIAYLFRRITATMPGLDLFGSSTPATANTVIEVVPAPESASAPAPIEVNEPEKAAESASAVSVPRGLAGGPAPYYNARLDPKNFLEGPLSWNPATRLRQMLARPGIVVAPGICDGISARCALEAGFDCLYQSGAATTASRLGQPDLAIATLNDFVQSAQMVCSLDPTVPVIADADTGFGGPAMVARTVTQYARAGVAALHIEDQVQTKRCGHLLGKQVVSREEFVTRIRAAVIARDAIPGGSDFVIIGRTDSAQVLGMEEALFRLKLAADAGADVCFIEGVKNAELLKSTVAALAPKPVLVNVISGGLTPSFTTREAEEYGAKIIIFSLVSCVAAVHGIRAAMASLKKTGTDFTSAKGMDPKAFFEVMGLNAVVNLDAQAGGKAFEQV